MQKNRYLFGFALAALALTGAGCPWTPSTPAPKPVTLEYWRTEDQTETLKGVIDAYQKIHPHVTINYRVFPTETYERELVTALAENRGPDMFSLPNVDLRGWKARLLPLPKEIQVATVTVNDQKQIVTENKKKPTMSMLELRNSFVEAAARDVVMWAPPEKADGLPEQRIYGLPFSLDTLGLYYNRELLKKANLEKPPANWNEFVNQVQALTLKGADGAIRQSGAALGTSANVRNYTDLLALIMLQNGAPLEDANGYPGLDQYGTKSKDVVQFPPGVEALLFYESFADPASQSYTWNADRPNSLDAFVAGQTAFYFGFPADARQIAERAPRLDFAAAPMPQVEPNKPASLAHYPVEVVSKKTTHVNEAWDFLQFAAQPEQATLFLQATKRPTALRTLIKSQTGDPGVAPFVNQVLTAKTWYRGTDYATVEEAFAYMIDTKPTPEQPEYQRIVSSANSMISATVPGDY
ncbi:MAG: extracellular solute-binding protein [Patescibacteria group bacterium]|nr:extracellular solute-binding protein [Patescibacteria group bacterium]